MIECDAMRDRMPDVVHGTDAWTDADLAHLASCTECALEWRLVRAGAQLGGQSAVAVDRVAQAVVGQLQADLRTDTPVRALPWRGGLIGLLAVAASLVLLLSPPQRSPQDSGGGSLDALAVLPELQALDEHQLESVLQSLGPTASDATPGILPHLEDLTESELEQLLRSEGGE